MFMLYSSLPGLTDCEREELWLRNVESEEAESAFARSRRRHLFRANRRGGCRLFIIGVPSRVFQLPVGAVCGVRQDDGGLSRSLPRLSRSLRRSWLNAYARAATAEEEDSRAFEFSLVGGKLYLEGGNSELIRLEVAKALGRAAIPAVIRSAGEDCVGRCCAA